MRTLSDVDIDKVGEYAFIKEQINITSSNTSLTGNVVIGLDKDLEVALPYIRCDGKYIDALKLGSTFKADVHTFRDILAFARDRNENLYYSFNDITYILNVCISRKTEEGYWVVEVAVYEPSIIKTSKIRLKDVSRYLPYDVLTYLSQKYKELAIERVLG